MAVLLSIEAPSFLGERADDAMTTRRIIIVGGATAGWLTAASWPEGLRNKIAQRRHRLPSRFDFVVDEPTILPPSWAFILHGRGFATEAAAEQAVQALPDRRSLITRYHRS